MLYLERAMRRALTLGLLAAVGLVMAAQPARAQPAPVITGITAPSRAPGETITLQGENFGTQKHYVTFSGLAVFRDAELTCGVRPSLGHEILIC